MANKAWPNAIQPSVHTQPPAPIDVPIRNGKAGWGKQAFVSSASRHGSAQQDTSASGSHPSREVPPHREIPPHLRNSGPTSQTPNPPEKPLTNGWSKVGAASAPALSGTARPSAVTGFKPIPTGPRTSTAPPPTAPKPINLPLRKPSVDHSSLSRTNGHRPAANGILSGRNGLPASDSGIDLGSSSSVPPRSGMSVFDDFDFRVNVPASKREDRRESRSSDVVPPGSPPPPPPREQALPPPPSPPPAVTPDQTARLLKSPEVRGKVTIGLGTSQANGVGRSHGQINKAQENGTTGTNGSNGTNGTNVANGTNGHVSMELHEVEQSQEPQTQELPGNSDVDIYPWIPTSPRTIRANPPDFTRHIPGRGNFKTCDPTLHHANEEKFNIGCGRMFKHEKPITRQDGSWQGKEVDTLEVKDPREEMDPAIRELGKGSKKNAVKGLIVLEPYDWDENSPFPKPADGICISNINPLTTRSQIEAAVSSVAKIKNIEMKLDPRTGMQMGICYVTFSPTEEHVPGDGKKKKATTVEVPGWRHARAAQMKLNGKPIGVNVGAQKESLMKVVLDPNGDRTRKTVEMELEKKRKAANPPVVVAPVQAISGSGKAEVPVARTAQALPAPGTSAPTPANAPSMIPMPPPTMLPARAPPARNDAFPKPYMQQAGPYSARPTTFDSRQPPRGNDRPNGTSYGHESSAQAFGNSRGYRDSSAHSKPVELGRLPPPNTNPFGSIRTSSSYTPSSQLGSFVSAPFPSSRGWDSRQRPGSFTETHRLPERPNPPSGLEDYHRRSSRSRRSPSVSRTNSDGSDSGDTSDGGRTPSPSRRLDKRRGLNRDTKLRRRASRGDNPAEVQEQDDDEASQLVAKVRDELRENGKAYIFIDHKSLPIPSATSDRERVLADLKDHLKAARIEKVTFNLHGWYVLFAEETAAKKIQMVFDKRVMSGRPLSLLVKEPLAKAPSSTAKKPLLDNPVKPQQTPQSSARKDGTPPRRNKGLPIESDEESSEKLPATQAPAVVRGTKKQKISRVVSSDDEAVAPGEEVAIPAEVVKSPSAHSKEAPATSDSFEDIPVVEQDESSITPLEAIVTDVADVVEIDADQPAPAKSEKRAGKSKRKSDAVAKPAKQPAAKRQKKAAPTVIEDVIAEDTETVSIPMEVDEVEPAPRSAKSTKANKKSKKAPPAAPVNPLSVFDLINSGVAADDEDLYYLRLAAEHSLKGTMPELPPDDEADPEGDEQLDGVPVLKHKEGCAKAHRYYKVPEVEKSAYLPQRNRAVAEVEAAASNATAVATSRSTRVNSRRLVQGMEQHKKGNASATDTDLFQFNQLRTRKKQLKFSKSPIHDWGLYAMEHITQGEMVIEYVGEVIRAQVADIREKWYEKTGIGSSYLFRVDDDAVVDATKKGNLGRLINHCCYPNCTAKIITINGEKKIVIYAKSNIEPGEEITYDYHFPIEQEKIPCLCGSDKCRGYLN